MKFSPLILITVSGLALLGAGCGKAPPRQPGAGHALPAPLISQCEPGQPGGRLHLVTSGAPQTLNPVLAGDGGAAHAVVRLLFAPLVQMDFISQQPTPGLAESWLVEADQKTWTFKLRPGLRWSDGQSLTADDVVFTWNDVVFNPAVNALNHDLFQIAGTNCFVTKLDEQTVRFVTPEVFAPFLELFGGVPILPSHALGPSVRERRFLSAYSLQTRPEKIVGAGPFRVKEVQPGRAVLLERNPEYWVVDRQNRRLPYFDEVLLTATSGAAGPALFLATHAALPHPAELPGDARSDVFETGRPEDFGPFKRASAAGQIRLAELGSGTERDFLWFNLNPGQNAAGQPYVNPARLHWFQNRKFRQAVSCAIDRDRIVREVYGGRARPIHTFVSTEDRRWNNPDVPVFAYDPARARVLLAEIGFADRDGDGVVEDTNGKKVQFSFYSNAGNPLRERCAGLIAEDLGKLGLKVDLQLLPFADLVDRISRTFAYDCILMGLGGGGADPAAQIHVLKSNGALHQWFPHQPSPATEWETRIDVLMDAQVRTLDYAARKRAFDEVQAILAEESPMIYTVAPLQFAATRTDIGNLRPSEFTPFRLTWNIEELFFRRP